jgi:hypothetical protein
MPSRSWWRATRRRNRDYPITRLPDYPITRSPDYLIQCAGTACASAMVAQLVAQALIH